MVEPITVRDYTPDDYAMLQAWWSARGYPAPPSAIFPPDCYIAERDGEALAFCAFYLSLGVGIAWVDWLVSKPGQSPAATALAFEVLHGEFTQRHGEAYTHIRGLAREGLQNAAKLMGYKIASGLSFEVIREVSNHG